MMVCVTPAMVRVNAIATRAHGIVDLRELLDAGLPRQTVALWARRGQLHRIHEGVYSVVPPMMLTLEGCWMAAVKAAGPEAALSHGSAAQLSWLIPRDPRARIHVLTADRSRRRVPGIAIHRPRIVEARDFTTIQGIRATTNERTVWDLAYGAPRSVVRDAFESADGHDRLDRDRLALLVAEHPARRGSRLLSELLMHSTTPLIAVRSWLEDLLARICSRFDLPRPAVNVPLLGFEADFLWESARLIVEADGGDHLKRSRRDRDNARDIAHQRAGYIIRRYSSRDMEREREVAGEILEILRERTSPRRLG